MPGDTPLPDQSSARVDLIGPILAWAVLLVVGLACRPPIPIDETRYLGVAWEMWTRGDLLVPYFLGEFYSHKPPLLFWGMHLGWWLFGVSEWWARCVAPLFGVATLVLTATTARVLWPERSQVACLVPWLLVGALFWSVFATLTMFDLLMAACALAGALGLALAALRSRASGFVLTAIAVAAGILAKGPVILLHLVPLMLAAPWWAAGQRQRWWTWYAGCASAVLIGGAIALCWAIPAAIHGGEEYANAIFWRQSAGRISGSEEGALNPHQHGWWWFLPFLPALLFPWAIWPPAWRALGKLRLNTDDPGVRWCLCWCGSAFVLHSLISGKQLHYLIPVVAPALLLLARLFDHDPDQQVRRRDHWPVAVVLGVAGVVLLITPFLDEHTLTLISLGNGESAPQEWGLGIGFIPGLVTLGVVITLIALPGGSPRRGAGTLALSGIALLVALHLGIGRAIRPAYDLEPLSRRIAAWQDHGIAVARIGSYRGEYQFLGRLTTAPETVDVDQIIVWARQHSDGMLLMTFSPKRSAPTWMGTPEEVLPHRGVHLGLWQAAHVVAHAADNRADD
ncbi:MAG TPA: glycosyltransferase family 39 protein [Planctomycetota bacterium]|nr:glycosyltransferase family 39 protein [Planctomycetota bacterium]